MQIRSKKCILQYPSTSILKKVCPVFVDREHLQVSLSVFRTWFYPSSIRKNNENSHFSAKETEFDYSNIFGQHGITGANKERNSEGIGFVDFLIEERGEKSQFQTIHNIEFL